MALGALKGLHDIGLRVPLDVSVVGFDNMQYDDYSIPPLTSVHSPVLDMATAAVKMLLDRIEDNARAELPQQTFAAKLVIRESTGPRGKMKNEKIRRSGVPRGAASSARPDRD
jgi:LacI family transcriptional regulator